MGVTGVLHGKADSLLAQLSSGGDLHNVMDNLVTALIESGPLHGKADSLLTQLSSGGDLHTILNSVNTSIGTLETNNNTRHNQILNYNTFTKLKWKFEPLTQYCVQNNQLEQRIKTLQARVTTLMRAKLPLFQPLKSILNRNP